MRPKFLSNWLGETAVVTLIVILAACVVGALCVSLMVLSVGLDHGFSGTRVPSEAASMSVGARHEGTEARAREILTAVRAFQSQHGRLPAALTDLVPAFLPSIPAPLVSTMPFEYRAEPDGTGFIVKWEAMPNSMYERYWIDQDGVLEVDM